MDKKSDNTISPENRLQVEFQTMLLANLPDAIIVTDLQYDILYWNKAAENQYGWKAEDVIGKPLEKFVVNDYLGSSLDLILAKIEKDGFWKGEVKQFRRDGVCLPILSTVSILKDQTGKPLGFIAINKDISESKQAKEKLQESEITFRSLFEKAPIGTAYHQMVYDQSGKPVNYRILEANHSYQVLTGTIDPVGKLVTEAFPGIENDPFDWIGVFGQVAKTGKEIRIQQHLQYNNRWYDLVAYQNKPDHFVATFFEITERKKAEEKLRDSEYLYKETQRIGKIGGWSYDVESQQSTFTDTIYEIYGKRFSLAEEGIQFYHQDDKEMVRNAFLDVISKQKPYDLEVRLINAQGDNLFVRTMGQPVIKNGKVIKIYGNLINVTEQKIAEQALIKTKQKSEESENYLHNIINNIGDPVFVKDEQSRMILVNDAFCNLYDLERDNIIGKTLAENVPLEEHEKFTRIDKDVIETGKENISEESISVIGRHSKIVSTRKSRYIDKNGNNFLIGSIRDITDRKKSEQALEAEKERLAVTLRSIGDGVITTDINGKITLMNKVAEELTGWNQAAGQGETFETVFSILNESTREPLANPVQKVLATGKILKMENHTLLISRDGTERVIADSGAPILDKNANTIGVVLVFRDTTEKQKFLEVTRNSQKLESLGVLAGGIAHDFNNLLGGIFGYLDLASEEIKDPKISSYLAKSLSTIDRARALTGQLMTFAKGGAPIKKLEYLHLFVQEIAQFALSGSTVLCRYQIPEDLWPCDLDRSQIGQVIDNLVINAQQAMPNGGKIEISAQNISLIEKQIPSLVAGNYVKLSIKDHGVGIPKEFLPNIFDPFYTTKPKGHGLGLSSCYSIVNRHDGYIEVESEPGKGSTFHVYLPATLESFSAAAKAVAGNFQGAGIFLIMDDEEIIREVIGKMLESLGYSVVLKKNGEDAVAWVTEETKAGRTLAGMIFDLTIPGGMGGREAIGEIRKLSLKTPVFVASGYAEDPVMSNPKDYGFSASICKPFRIAELINMLNDNITAKKS